MPDTTTTTITSSKQGQRVRPGHSPMQQGLTNHKWVTIKTPFHSPSTPVSAGGSSSIITYSLGQGN